MDKDKLYEMMDTIAQEVSTWDRPDHYIELCQAAFDVAFCTMFGPCDGTAEYLPDAIESLKSMLDDFNC